MEIDVRTVGVKQLTRNLSRIQRRQIPYSTAVALTRTAQDIQRAEKAQMVKKLDRPTRNTVNSVRIKSATKTNLTARVFLLPWASEYLRWQIFGGIRPVKTAVPTSNARLNSYGNIPGRKTGLVKRKNQFAVKGVGVFKRVGRGKQRKAVLEYAMVKNPQYGKRWDFYRIADGVAANRFPKQFKKALDKALATAR